MRIRKRIGKLFRDLPFLMAAMVAVLLARGLVALLPYTFLRKVMVKATRQAEEERGNRNRGVILLRLMRAVHVVSRRVPGANCLVQALGAWGLLRILGVHSQLRVGVKKEGEGEFKAHAWLELENQVLIGGTSDFERFTALRPVEKN